MPCLADNLRDVQDRRRSIVGRAYNLRTLSERHHRILRLHLLGYKSREIARELGITEASVSTALNSNLGRLQTSILRERADQHAVESAAMIRKMAPKALKVIDEILDDEEVPSSVRLRAAQDALDRAGFAPIKRVDVNQTSISLSGDDLSLLRERALVRAQESGLIVDVGPQKEALHLSPNFGNSDSLLKADRPHAVAPSCGGGR